jgi:hypothetical protein
MPILQAALGPLWCSGSDPSGSRKPFRTRCGFPDSPSGWRVAGVRWILIGNACHRSEHLNVIPFYRSMLPVQISGEPEFWAKSLQLVSPAFGFAGRFFACGSGFCVRGSRSAFASLTPAVPLKMQRGTFEGSLAVRSIRKRPDARHFVWHGLMHPPCHTAAIGNKRLSRAAEWKSG